MISNSMRHYKAQVKVLGTMYYEGQSVMKGSNIRYLVPPYEETYLLYKDGGTIWLPNDLEIENSLPLEVANGILGGVAKVDPSEVLYINYLGVEKDTITLEVKLKPHFNLNRFQNPTIISREYWHDNPLPIN